MKVKDVVFQEYQGIRRYGVIRERYEEKGWAHFKVDWVEDGAYNRAMNTLAELRGRNFYRHAYRCDELCKIDAEQELKTLFKCLELSNL
jgi:Lon protease-like protein